jgi:hypothetical protein
MTAFTNKTLMIAFTLRSLLCMRSVAPACTWIFTLLLIQIIDKRTHAARSLLCLRGVTPACTYNLTYVYLFKKLMTAFTLRSLLCLCVVTPACTGIFTLINSKY